MMNNFLNGMFGKVGSGRGLHLGGRGALQR